MKNSLKKWEVIGVFIIFALCFPLHLGYEKTHFTPLALICPKNESIWEHAKMGFYAALIYAIVEYLLIGKKYKNFWYGKLKAVYTMPIAIIVIYYTYTGIIGRHYVWIDITIALVAAGLAQYIGYFTIISRRDFERRKYIAIAAILVGVIIFTIFTFMPPALPLFDGKQGKS